ncbi:MAG: SDR family NAD(P)-dependent oxidoreductase, partial [Alphaproteobacteria bacterium]|nr:SDR family NAD(P)-dependent oxidoreductase [Alphaproteobacteria bacterium]
MKTAFVTGGGGGLGAAIAARAAAQGYKVAVVDMNHDNAKAIAATIKGAVPLQADVTSERSVEKALDDFGAVPDLVVNNAGLVRFGPLLDQSFDDFRSVVAVNLVGAHIVSVLAARRMVKRGSGSIVN